jgi:hypothetical protein
LLIHHLQIKKCGDVSDSLAKELDSKERIFRMRRAVQMAE